MIVLFAALALRIASYALDNSAEAATPARAVQTTQQQ
jgi:hypothetical protein